MLQLLEPHLGKDTVFDQKPVQTSLDTALPLAGTALGATVPAKSESASLFDEPARCVFAVADETPPLSIPAKMPERSCAQPGLKFDDG